MRSRSGVYVFDTLFQPRHLTYDFVECHKHKHAHMPHAYAHTLSHQCAHGRPSPITSPYPALPAPRTVSSEALLAPSCNSMLSAVFSSDLVAVR